ncbi:hypothetical protein ACUH9X_08290 [Dermabacteraceae bacterium P13147]
MFILVLQFCMFAATPIFLDRGLSRCLTPKYAELATAFIVLATAVVGVAWGMSGLYWVGCLAFLAFMVPACILVWYLIVNDIFLNKDGLPFDMRTLKTFIILALPPFFLLGAASLSL